MSGSGAGHGSGAPRPLDVDDQQMWEAARRAPLSAAALQRIADGVTSRQPARVFAWRELGRWRVLAAAALLLLIGGVAGAALVIRRQNTEAIREAPAPVTRVAPAHGRHDQVPETSPVQPPPVALPDLPVPVAEPARAAIAPRRKAPPVQLALRAPAPATRTMVEAPAPAPLPSRSEAPLPLPPAQPVPAAAPSLGPPPATEAPSPGRASTEAGILRAALTALHHDNDPGGALALLDQYDARFPKGTLRGEATLARAHSLRELGRDDELLRLLERVRFADLPRAAELRVLRGELRLTRGRFADALADFEAVPVAGAPDPIVERALFGRAACRSRLGDADGARADLRRYLERFPAAPRAAEVRARLAR